VGKTTTAVNLSSCLALLGKKVLLLDIDPQANTTSGLGYEKEKVHPSIYDILIDGIPAEKVILQGPIKGLDVILSNISLAGAELQLFNLEKREFRLKNALESLRQRYDYIFIDSPPSLNLLTINGLVAADSVLIPVQCAYYALEGLSQLLGAITLVQSRLNPNLKLEGMLMTMFDSRTNHSHQVLKEVRSCFKDKVFQNIIPNNVRLSEAPSFGKPVVLYDINSTGAKSYMLLARELIAKS
jgi:chromosome partitioning protein